MIFEWRKFFLQIKENISVSHITYVLYDCADIYFYNSKKKKQSWNFLKLKKLFFGRIAMHSEKRLNWLKENDLFGSLFLIQTKDLFDLYNSCLI